MKTALYLILAMTCLVVGSGDARAAVTIPVIGNNASWPSMWTSIGAGDGIDSGVTGARDLVGQLQYAQDNEYIYFRMQLNTPSLTSTENASYLIYIDRLGVGTAGIPDFGFAWDSKSNDPAKHGLEMGRWSSGGTTWGGVIMDDVDGITTSKGTADINGPTGSQRTTDGYLSIVTGADGYSGTGANSYIEMAVSWNYLRNNSLTGLGQGQTWNVAAGVINASNDHGSINANGDVGAGANSGTLLQAGGWSGSITTVPEAPATPLAMGGLAGLFALTRSRRRVAAFFGR